MVKEDSFCLWHAFLELGLTLPGLVITWLQTSEQTVSEEISKVHDGVRRVKEAPHDMRLSGEAKTLPSERR